MRGWKEKRISNLLRMAELCSSDQEERKNMYMDEVDKLLFDDVDELKTIHIADLKYRHLEKFYEMYKDKLNNNTPPNAYEIYIKFCQYGGFGALDYLPFCKAMNKFFPIQSVLAHSGKGSERMTFKKWVLSNG